MINAIITINKNENWNYFHLVNIDTQEIIASFGRGYAGTEPVKVWAKINNINVIKGINKI